MLKCLGVLAILAVAAGGCVTKPAPADAPPPDGGRPAAAQFDTPAVQFNPCEHGVYERLKENLLARPVRLDDRDRNYLFELDRLCRAHSKPARAAAAGGLPPVQLPDAKVPACTRAVYTHLRESVYTDPGRLKDEDHWYFHELDRACVQGKSAIAAASEKPVTEAAAERKSNRNPYHWLALLTGLGALAWNLVVSAR